MRYGQWQRQEHDYDMHNFFLSKTYQELVLQMAVLMHQKLFETPVHTVLGVFCFCFGPSLSSTNTSSHAIFFNHSQIYES